MSLVKQVLEDVYANRDIVVVDVKIRNFIPERDGYWSETVDIVVAPKRGIYNGKELNHLLNRLTKANWTSRDEFNEIGPNTASMSFGKLYFDENIGLENAYIRRDIALTEEDLLAKDFKGFQEGKLTIEEKKKIPLTRRTWLRLYPNVNIALRAVNEGENVYSIDVKLLNKEKGGRCVRLLARLGIRS